MPFSDMNHPFLNPLWLNETKGLTSCLCLSDSNSIRYSSEQEIIASRTQKNLERTDSQLTNTSTKSHSSTQSYPAMAEDFDSLEDLPRCGKKAKKVMLGDIGKTRSAGDLFKNSKKPTPLIRTFQQLNIMKLPSVDSVTSDHSKSLTRLNTYADPLFDDITNSRQKAYEMK